ncbi:ABC-F family ATPase [Parachitinimonas caeni]|uniref:ABC-F family ATPase n=1 Tax=Parachitinimonas caeni TaxID=3031301 RepID=A0ABT7DX71_9NEIS|nr:ABC-F family ATPase [Parachitinimonas caeni]MDK2124589.1 ABC-F family ATPase [Parachitinimonas caeni]
MITTSNITMQFGSKPLFDKVSIKFGDGNRYGLIGANGCGKSTFMKILGGDLEQTAGNVSLEPGVRLGKLKQDQFAYEECRVLDVVLMGHTEMWEVAREKDAIYANPDATEEDYMRAADLEAKFGELGGYDAEARAGALLLGAGIPTEQHNGPMSEIAPGWKLRVLLAQALFSDPDVLLLDEPTNNLDINTIRWLEHTLNDRESTMIIISHDRHFLNQVCTHMADLDYNTIQIYPGNYDDYMLASMQARERQLSANAKAKEKVSELQQFAARFAANKSKARQATSRLRLADKIKSEMVEVKPSSRQNPYVRFDLEDKQKLHRQAFEATEVSFAYEEGPTILKDLNLIFEAGQKLAVIGGNGVGKSTLMKLLVGQLKPQTGFIKWADKAEVGYFAQDHEEDFSEDITLFDWMKQWSQPGDDDQTIRGILGRLLFSGDDVKKSVKVLSGGEKGRMLYGKLILERPNVLVMDEPTNHMDMESIESLNMALELYKGTLIFVSHDRQFVSSLATQVLELKGDGSFVHYMGNYEDYLSSQGLE